MTRATLQLTVPLLFLAACGPSIQPPARPASTLPPVAPTSAPPSATPEVPAPPSAAIDDLLGDVGEAPLLLHMIDIGQGDAFLIETPKGKRVTIDTGPRRGRAALLAFLDERRIDRIDLHVTTHAHADHMANLVKVIETREVKQILSSGVPHTTHGFKKMLDAIERARIPFRVARKGRVITLEEGITLKVLGPEEPLVAGSRSDLNSNSVLLRLDYGAIRVLFTGDAEHETEHRLLAQGPEELKATILKVAHHGSAHATSAELLAAVAPRIGLISAAQENRYGHPAPSTLGRLRGAGVALYETRRHGHTTIATNGEVLRIDTQKTPPPEPAAAVAAQHGDAAQAAPGPTPGALDLNSASAAELIALPGVGKTTARRIIEWREAHGGFRTVDDLVKVKGVGKKTLAKLRPLVRVAPPDRS